MKQYKVKVNHRRFLNIDDFKKLTYFGIKVILNNHVYNEYTSHIISNVELTEEQFNELNQQFEIEIKEDLIIINMNK